MRKTFSLPVAASAGGGGPTPPPPNNLDNIDYSIRLIKADDHYFSRSSVAGNSQTWTWSGWVKKHFSDETEFIFSGFQSISSTGLIKCFLGPNGEIRIVHSSGTWFDGQAEFRDTAAWYHVVVAVDSTQSNAADQIKVYVNGTEQTGTRYAMTVNQTTGMNMSNGTHYIGSDRLVSHSDLYIADVQMVDGQALSASYFGFFDSDNVWQPKAFNQSYGTNGYHLDFADVSSVNTYGNDVSGNNNDFTAHNIDSTDVMYDSPVDDTSNASYHRGNYCTLNALNKGSNATLSAGNLEYDSTSGGSMAAVGTMAVTSGKWYYETICPNAQLGPGYNPNMFSGVVNVDVWDKVFDTDMFSTQGNGVYGYAWYDGDKTVDGSESAFNQGGTAKDTNNNPTVIGVALDLDNGTISIYENGSSLGTIAQGVSGMFAPIIDSTSNNSGQQAKVNFGQQGFEYPLSGYNAWSTAALSTPSIADGSEHFNATIWTGDNASSRAITGLNHGSDFVWIKRRDNSASHVITDCVRGADKILASDSTSGEATDSNAVKSFDSDGFTIGQSQNWNTNLSQQTYVGWSWAAGSGNKTYNVTVSQGVFVIDGQSQPAITLAPNTTYTFDQSDQSNSGHPFRFSTTSDGVHGGGRTPGTEYTNGVSYSGTPGSAGAYTQITTQSGPLYLHYYCSNHSGMGNTSTVTTTEGSTNFDGSITAVVKANPTAGFSISKFTAPTQGSGTFGHGLNKAPGLVVMKSVDQTKDWVVFVDKIASTDILKLSSVGPASTDSSFNSTAPTSSVVSIGSAYAGAGETIAYNFAEIEGFSKIGTYHGNSSATVPPFINTGFTPSFIIIKNHDGGSGNWAIFDTARQDFNDTGARILPEIANGEFAGLMLDFVSNGFRIKSSTSVINYSTREYVYMAFAEHPFKTSRGR